MSGLVLCDYLPQPLHLSDCMFVEGGGMCASTGHCLVVRLKRRGNNGWKSGLCKLWQKKKEIERKR